MKMKYGINCKYLYTYIIVQSSHINNLIVCRPGAAQGHAATDTLTHLYQSLHMYINICAFVLRPFSGLGDECV